MKENNAYINHLFQKYLEGHYSEQELDTLLAYFKLDEDSEQLRALIEQQLDQPIPDTIDRADVERRAARIGAELEQQINPPVKMKRFRWWYAAAAVLLLFSISISTYYIIHRKKEIHTLTSKFGGDVLPGGNNAYVTLSNGKQIDLDSTQSLVKTIDGKILYANGEELATNAESEIATINTPVGAEYQLILPDGTKAWLNAASSIKYPTRFDEKERSIEVQGEVYLEVESDKNKPFIVQSDQQRIEVLGTAFNIRNYTGNAITTLVHGKIALKNKETQEQVTLTPGQQSIISNGIIDIKKVDPLDYVSWKDGLFTNKDASLAEICKELERWYAVKFIYPNGFKNSELAYNTFNRTERLSTVLEALKITYKVDFEIKGKEVIVK